MSPAVSARASLVHRHWPSGALASADFRKLLLGLAISKSGDWLYGVALQVFIFEKTHSATWVAAATVVRMLPYAALGTVGGALADRFERRAIMIGCDLIRAVLMGGLTLIALFNGSPPLTMALVLVSSTASTPYTPATAAMTPRLVDENDLAAANAAISAVDYSALVVGPLIGGLLLLVGSPAAAFGFNALTFLGSALAVSLISVRSRGELAQDMQGFIRGVLEGWRTVKHSAAVAVVIALISATGLIYGLDTVLLVLVANKQLTLGAAGYGYLLAAFGLGGLGGAVLAARLIRVAPPVALLAATVIAEGSSLTALAFVSNLAVALVLIAVQGFCSVTADIVGFTLLQRGLRQDVMARVFGVLASTSLGSILIGALVAPALTALAGLRGALILGGVALPVVVVAVLPRIRSLTVTAERTLAEIEPRIAVLDRLRIFRGASGQAIELLARTLEEKSVPALSVVIRQGEPATAFFVLVAGEAQVLSSGQRRGRPRVVARLAAGDYFGEIGIIEQVPRTATVRTLTECKLYRIDADDFLTALARGAVTSSALREGIAIRLARTHPHLGPVPASAPTVPSRP